MLRVRAHQHLDTLPVPEHLLPYDGHDEPEEPIIPPGAPPEKAEEEVKKEVMWWEVPGYELTSDEALLFGDRVEEPVQAEAPDATMEEPPAGEELTITQMLDAAKGSGHNQVYISNGDPGYVL